MPSIAYDYGFKMGKRGNIGSLFPAVVALVLVGMLIPIGMVILSNMQDNSYKNTDGVIVNESIAFPVEAKTLSAATLRNVKCLSILAVSNGTGGGAISADKFTLENCKVTTTEEPDNYAANILVSYSYNYDADTATSKAVGKVNESINQFIVWMPIIIVVIAAGIVIVILVTSLNRKKK